MSPNNRTVQHYKKLGYMAAIVEHWNPFPKPWGKRHDMFGFADIVVFSPGETWLVQATTGAHVANRIEKLRGIPEVQQAKQLGVKVLVTGWSKCGPRGKRKIWQMKEIVL